jgi:hypothetical protein
MLSAVLEHEAMKYTHKLSKATLVISFDSDYLRYGVYATTGNSNTFVRESRNRPSPVSSRSFCLQTSRVTVNQIVRRVYGWENQSEELTEAVEVNEKAQGVLIMMRSVFLLMSTFPTQLTRFQNYHPRPDIF